MKNNVEEGYPYKHTTCIPHWKFKLQTVPRLPKNHTTIKVLPEYVSNF